METRTGLICGPLTEHPRMGFLCRLLSSSTYIDAIASRVNVSDCGLILGMHTVGTSGSCLLPQYMYDT